MSAARQRTPLARRLLAAPTHSPQSAQRAVPRRWIAGCTPRGATPGRARGGIPGSFRRWRRSSCASTSANSATWVTVSSTWFTPQSAFPADPCVLAMASRAKARPSPRRRPFRCPTWGTSSTLGQRSPMPRGRAPRTSLRTSRSRRPSDFELSPSLSRPRARSWPRRCRSSCQRPTRYSRPPGRYRASALR